MNASIIRAIGSFPVVSISQCDYADLRVRLWHWHSFKSEPIAIVQPVQPDLPSHLDDMEDNRKHVFNRAMTFALRQIPNDRSRREQFRQGHMIDLTGKVNQWRIKQHKEMLKDKKKVYPASENYAGFEIERSSLESRFRSREKSSIEQKKIAVKAVRAFAEKQSRKNKDIYAKVYGAVDSLTLERKEANKSFIESIGLSGHANEEEILKVLSDRLQPEDPAYVVSNSPGTVEIGQNEISDNSGFIPKLADWGLESTEQPLFYSTVDNRVIDPGLIPVNPRLRLHCQINAIADNAIFLIRDRAHWREIDSENRIKRRVVFKPEAFNRRNKKLIRRNKYFGIKDYIFYPDTWKMRVNPVSTGKSVRMEKLERLAQRLGNSGLFKQRKKRVSRKTNRRSK
jgi:hypothetical protein